MTRGVWIFLAMASISSVAAQCNSSCCRSQCRCNRCSSAPCRRQRTLKDELMTYHEAATGGEVFKRTDEAFPDRKLATCPCQSPTDSQAYYCCSTDGTKCGLGDGYPGINGLDGTGTICLGRCDLAFACPSNDCCSIDGFCGSASRYCENPMAACNNRGSAPLVSRAGVSPDAWECGGGYRNSGRCRSAAHCCSQWGWCDKPGSLTLGDHCSTSVSQTVWKRGGYVTESYSQSTTYCGSGTIGNGKCLADSAYGVPAHIMCCSPNGWCGNYGNDPSGDAYCGVSATVDTCPVCQNSGTCSSPATACTCINGFTGTTCDTAPSTAPTTVSCASGTYITRVDLFADSTVNGVSSFTCSNSITTQVSSGLAGAAYTAISGDGSSVSPGYCSYSSGTSFNYVTQLKLTECSGNIDCTYGSNKATVTVHDCNAGKRATGIKFASRGGSLISFAFLCGTITKTVSCASSFYITKIVLQASDIVYGIKSFRCSDGVTQQISTGLTGGTSITALSDAGSNQSVGYCAYSKSLSGSFVTQLTFTECTTSAIDGPFGFNSASSTPVSVACTSGKRATGITTITGTALTSFAFICSSPTTTTPSPTTSSTTTPKTTSSPTAPKTASPTTASASVVGYFQQTWASTRAGPTGVNLGVAFSGEVDVALALSTSASCVSTLHTQKYLELGGGTRAWTIAMIQKLNSNFANIISGGYTGVCYNLEVGDGGLADYLKHSFAQAKRAGLKVLVTFPHQAPYSFPDGADIMNMVFASTDVDYLSPQLYSSGTESSNDYALSTAGTNGSINWTSYKASIAKITPAIVKASYYTNAQNKFLNSYGITMSGFIAWS